MATPIRALVLDFGEVLTRKQPDAIVAEMARAAHVTEPRFLDAYWAHRRDYDLGLAAADYWSRVLASCEAPDNGTGDSPVAVLIQTDARSWTDYRESMWDVAAAFHAAGGRTAILSNGPPEVIAHVREDRPLEHWFDEVVLSCELGIVKPSREIYDACLARLDVRAEETLFVDDRQENIEAAARMGLQVVHFTGDERVAEVRERLGLPAQLRGES